jgi:hypothetical protein
VKILRRITMIYSKRILFGIFLLATFLVSMTFPASAYVYDGCKWPTGDVYYSVDSSVPSDWSSSIIAGHSAWNNVYSGFYFHKNSASSNKIYYRSLGSYSTLAVTTVSSSGGIINGCTVDFNSDLGALWSTSGDLFHYDVQSVAAHEFGHWLSLGHSSNWDATMYYRTPIGETKKRTLHSDDIAGIESIY